mmetsp:Transcript_59610/g.158608  ORF Transcript_59610/g.158608 Transcript_59610/m.158608 type:complete len:351 (+) Transcript_59610:1496-2548(+)
MVGRNVIVVEGDVVDVDGVVVSHETCFAQEGASRRLRHIIPEDHTVQCHFMRPFSPVVFRHPEIYSATLSGSVAIEHRIVNEETNRLGRDSATPTSWRVARCEGASADREKPLVPHIDASTAACRSPTTPILRAQTVLEVEVLNGHLTVFRASLKDYPTVGIDEVQAAEHENSVVVLGVQGDLRVARPLHPKRHPPARHVQHGSDQDGLRGTWWPTTKLDAAVRAASGRQVVPLLPQLQLGAGAAGTITNKLNLPRQSPRPSLFLIRDVRTARDQTPSRTRLSELVARPAVCIEGTIIAVSIGRTRVLTGLQTRRGGLAEGVCERAMPATSHRIDPVHSFYTSSRIACER